MAIIDMGRTRATFIEAGSGETVVLLHASASSGAQWRRLMQMLQSLCHLVAPDLYGYGETEPWPGERRFALGEEVELIDELLARRRGPVHLVGHSYGGAVALRFAQQNPLRIRSLILIEPVAFHLLRDGDDTSADRLLYQEICRVSSVMSKGLITGDLVAAMAHFIDYWSGDGAWERLDDKTQKRLAGEVAQIALNFWATMTEETAPSAYASITAPSLVLRGSCSPRPAQRVAELIAKILPTARLRTIAGAGHMLPLSHPEEVKLAIAAHLFPARHSHIELADLSL